MKVRLKNMSLSEIALRGYARMHENGTILVAWSDGFQSQHTKQNAGRILVFIVPAPSRKV